MGIGGGFRSKPWERKKKTMVKLKVVFEILEIMVPLIAFNFIQNNL